MNRWIKNKNGVLVPNRQAGFIQPGIGLMNKKQGGGSGDPYWSNVVSLLHFDGSNGSTSIADEKGLAWNASSGAALSTSQFKFAPSSLYIGTSTSAYVRTSQTAGYNFGTSDFTVELSQYRLAATTSILYCAQSGTSQLNVVLNPSNNIQVSDQSVWRYSSNTAPLSQWNHIAIGRHSGTFFIFINGVLGYSGSMPASIGGSSYAIIGNSYSYSQGTQIYIDEFRTTSGICRYTTNFTPPVSPFPNHA